MQVRDEVEHSRFRMNPLSMLAPPAAPSAAKEEEVGEGG